MREEAEITAQTRAEQRAGAAEELVGGQGVKSCNVQLGHKDNMNSNQEFCSAASFVYGNFTVTSLWRHLYGADKWHFPTHQ